MDIITEVRKCIANDVPERILCFPIGLDFNVSNSSHTYNEFRSDIGAIMDVASNMVEKFGCDWFLLHPDDVLEYEMLDDLEIMFRGNLPAGVLKYCSSDKASIQKLRLPEKIKRTGRVKTYLSSLESLKDKYGNSILLTGRIAAPFSAAAVILGVQALMYLMIDSPSVLKDLLKRLTDYNSVFAEAQLEAGADAVFLGDCVGSSHFISLDHYNEFAFPYASICAKRIKGKDGICIYHSNEKSQEYLEVAAKGSFDIINIGEDIPLLEVKKSIGDLQCIMGNLDPINILHLGTPNQVEAAVKNMLLSCKSDGGYIFSTGEGITAQTPEENVYTMVQAVKKFGTY